MKCFWKWLEVLLEVEAGSELEVTGSSELEVLPEVVVEVLPSRFPLKLMTEG
ncbi:hypothetical protein H6F90_00280 [Trichocoleus sp. FACHB-591]|uniref:hypothetical protein n=1 Tax=Trichocoleus sp. FACHB-591 TaxID=2692872 RepID=UPI001686CF2A|nr:hypothetical protein [Trichocoleus sp. FACHB-591]MBD2093591.1 hypothetical protein [Trichocoleus sp. FACHB-591]